MFVGWDWASATHDVTVLDDAGAVVDRWALRHTEQDLAGALDRLWVVGRPHRPSPAAAADGLAAVRHGAAGRINRLRLRIRHLRAGDPARCP
jgi:hypothetical protein